MFRCLNPLFNVFCRVFLLSATAAALITASFVAAADPSTRLSGELNLKLMVSGGEQRQIYQQLIGRFRDHYPDIDVRHREYELEAYKANIEKWLGSPDSPPDVLFYFAGHLMADLFRAGLVRPITDLWESENWDQTFPDSIRNIVMHDGQPMGLPVSYYHWGIYYRKSLFDSLGLTIPRTWRKFLEVGEALRSRGIAPIAMGSEARWPAAAWFDYLNLRINGLEFHQSLLAGKEAFDDDRVRRVFEVWKDLVDRDFFLPNHNQLSWRGALPYLYQKQAAMMLMGGFVVPQFPDQIRDDIGLFRFPVIDPGQPIAEEAPTDVLFIPSRARNVKEAEAFVRFLARPDIQSWFNQRLGTIAPNRLALPPEDRLVSEGQMILQAASGYSQFFDRQVTRSVSTPAMETLVDFLDGELSVDATLQTLSTITGSRQE